MKTVSCKQGLKHSGPVYTIPFSFHIGLVSYRIGLLFTRYGFHSISDWPPAYTRTHQPLCFIPFSRFQMKTLLKWHETDPISCKRSNPMSTQYGTSLSNLLASNPLGELRRMRSGTIAEYGETITVQGETVSCKQNPNPL